MPNGLRGIVAGPRPEIVYPIKNLAAPTRLIWPSAFAVGDLFRVVEASKRGAGQGTFTTRDSRVLCTVMHGNPWKSGALTEFMEMIDCRNPGVGRIFQHPGESPR